MQLMLHQRQNKKREQQKDTERTLHHFALQDYQKQMMLLEQHKGQNENLFNVNNEGRIYSMSGRYMHDWRNRRYL